MISDSRAFLSISIFLPKVGFMFLMVSDPDYGEDRKDVQPVPSCLKPRNPEIVRDSKGSR